MTVFCCAFNFTFILMLFIQALCLDNLFPIVSSSVTGLPLAPLLQAKAIRDEGIAIFAMVQAIPKLALLSGL